MCPTAFACFSSRLGVPVDQHQLRVFDQHFGPRRHAFGQPDVAADDRTGPDDRVAAQDGGPGVDDDAVVKSGMPFMALEPDAGVAGQ